MDANTINTTESLWDNYATLLAASSYDPQTRDLLSWLVATAKKENWTLKQAAKAVGYSYSTLSKIFYEQRDAAPDQVISSIANFRRRYHNNTWVADIPFVDTEISTKITRAIEYAIEYQEIVSLVGKSQIGKTTTCEEYKRRKDIADSNAGYNASRVILVRIPTSPSALRVTNLIARELKLGQNLRYEKMMERIKQALTPSHVLIFDEVHQVCMTGARGLKTIETIRELYDETHCGMVLIGTDVWGKTLSGEACNGHVIWRGMPTSWEGVLSQTILRGINIYLPKNLSYADQQRIWKAFGLPDPDPATLKIVQQLVRQYGLGRYVKRMRSGATTARKAGKEFTWGYFVAVHNQLEKLAQA